MINTNSTIIAQPPTSRSFDLHITNSTMLKSMNHTDPEEMFIMYFLKSRLRGYIYWRE